MPMLVFSFFRGVIPPEKLLSADVGDLFFIGVIPPKPPLRVPVPAIRGYHPQLPQALRSRQPRPVNAIKK